MTTLVQITQLLDFSQTTAVIQVLNQHPSVTLLIRTFLLNNTMSLKSDLLIKTRIYYKTLYNAYDKDRWRNISDSYIEVCVNGRYHRR